MKPSKKLVLIATFFLLSAIPLTLFLALERQEVRKKATAPTDYIAVLNSQLLQANQQYGRIFSLDKQIIKDNLLNIASQRKRLLLEEIKTNPGAFLGHVLPPDEREQLPKELHDQGLIEQDIEIKGTLSISHFDDFENRRSRITYRIDPIGAGKGLEKFYNLYFTKDTPVLFTNSTVIVKGIALDSELISDPKILQGVKTLNINPPVTIGDFKMIVLMFNFTNYRIQPFTREQIISTVFTDNYSVDRFYRENSFNQTSFFGDVTNWFELDVSNNNCDGYFQLWAEKVKAMATAQGYNLSNYNRIAYLFPAGGDCSWGGAAGTYEIWINGMNVGNIPDSGTFIHELGHTFGLAHSNLIKCGSKAIDIYSNCQAREYWDRYDEMGIQRNHFNAAHKIKLGWIPQDRILEVTTSGTYSLSPLEVSGNGYQALRIRKPDTDQYYYLEYRQPIGFDIDLPNNIRNTLIRIFSETNPFVNGVAGTFLIDTTPDPASYGSDEALMDGATFFDQINNITVTQTGHNENFATVSVMIPVPTFPPTATPRLTPSPTPVPNAGKALYLKFLYWNPPQSDYVTIPDSNGIFAVGNEMTIEVWIRQEIKESATIIGKFPVPYYDDQWVYVLESYGSNFEPQPNTSQPDFAIRTTSGIVRLRSPDMIKDDGSSWNHLAVTKNGNELKLFVNGELKVTKSFSGSIVDKLNSEISMGAFLNQYLLDYDTLYREIILLF